MENLKRAIERSLETENWYGALAVALTLPDVCARLADPAARGRRAYIGWVDMHLTPLNTRQIGPGPATVFMNGTDCYALRCAFLHAGVDDVTEQEVAEAVRRFCFSTRGGHLIRVDGLLVLNVTSFCRDMLMAVDGWRAEHANDRAVNERIGALLEIRTEPFDIAPGIRMG